MTEASLATVSAGVCNAIAQYTQAQDAGHADALAERYTEDGVLEIPGMGSWQGRDVLRTTFLEWAPQQPQLHVVANTAINEWTAESASATSDVVFFQKGEDGWSAQIVGRYVDTLALVEDTWLFTRRISQFSMPG